MAELGNGELFEKEEVRGAVVLPGRYAFHRGFGDGDSFAVTFQTLEELENYLNRYSGAEEARK